MPIPCKVESGATYSANCMPCEGTHHTHIQLPILPFIHPSIHPSIRPSTAQLTTYLLYLRSWYGKQLYAVNPAPTEATSWASLPGLPTTPGTAADLPFFRVGGAK